MTWIAFATIPTFFFESRRALPTSSGVGALDVTHAADLPVPYRCVRLACAASRCPPRPQPGRPAVELLLETWSLLPAMPANAPDPCSSVDTALDPTPGPAGSSRPGHGLALHARLLDWPPPPRVRLRCCATEHGSLAHSVCRGPGSWRAHGWSSLLPAGGCRTRGRQRQ